MRSRMERVLAVVGSAGAIDDGQVTTSADDLGLTRGESAFEATRIYRGQAFRLQQHLQRLERSAAALGITLDLAQVWAVCDRAVQAAAGGDAVLRLYCTKGPLQAAGRGTVWAIVGELPEGLGATRARGATGSLLQLAVDPLVRASSPWLLPGVKSTSYAVNMAATREAQARGVDEAVFVGLGGELLEGPTTNVWWRTGDTLYTPTLELGILAGVTRAALLELAPGCGYRVVEGVFTRADLHAADEAFISSSVREVMPLVTVDGHPVGDGRPGPATRALQSALRTLALTPGPRDQDTVTASS